MMKIEKKRRLEPGLVCSNTLTGKAEIIVWGSDGSVHLEQRVGSAAWVLHEDDNHALSACFIMNNVSSMSSYRLELEGSFRLLKHAQMCGMTETEIAQWGDNERAVASTNNKVARPKDMIKPEADLIMAIHNLKKDMPKVLKCRHVYAHQDSRKSDRKRKAKKKRRA